MHASIRTRRKWTAVEDLTLCHAAEIQMRQGAVKCWNEIAANIPNRTNKDCRKRWNRIGKNIKKGPWSKEEDEALCEAVGCFGLRWTLVAGAIGSRYADQCAKRWHHSLDPSLDRSNWSEDEDERLVAAVKTYGKSWRVISEKEFSLRSTTAIKNRYYILTRRRHSLLRSSGEIHAAAQAGHELEDENASEDDSDCESGLEVLNDESCSSVMTGSSNSLAISSLSLGPGTPSKPQTCCPPNLALSSRIEFDFETQPPANSQECSDTYDATFTNAIHTLHGNFINCAFPDPLDTMDMDWNTLDLPPPPATFPTLSPLTRSSSSVNLGCGPTDLGTLDPWFCFANSTQAHENQKAPQGQGTNNDADDTAISSILSPVNEGCGPTDLGTLDPWFSFANSTQAHENQKAAQGQGTNNDADETAQAIILRLSNVSSSVLYAVMDVLMKSRTKFNFEKQ